LSYDDSLDKDRLYFTQCNDPFPNRCLECTSTKILRHCKIYRNFPAVWRHLKQDHNDILESRMDEIIQILNHTFKAFQGKMFPTWEFSEKSKTTTSSSILMDGLIPRGDRLAKLGKIANLLKLQSEHFPKFKRKFLLFLMDKVLGPCDPRTKKKYIDCVLRYSKKDNVNVNYDVTGFCDILGA